MEPVGDDHAGGGQKRPTPPVAVEETHRSSKRGKYTSIACEECKRRKIKCTPGQDYAACQRCVAGGVACKYPEHREAAVHAIKTRADKQSEIQALRDHVKQLSQQMSHFTHVIHDIQTRLDTNEGHRQPSIHPPPSNYSSDTITNGPPPQAWSSSSNSNRAIRPPRLPHIIPQQPQFVGPTRSMYSIEIGEESLTRMGIPSFDLVPQSDAQSPDSSSEVTPEEEIGGLAAVTTTALDKNFWQRCDVVEVRRLLDVFQDEVTSVYPCVDVDYLDAGADQILLYGRGEAGAEAHVNDRSVHENNISPLDIRDFWLAELAIATAIVVEMHGRNEESTMMVESVEKNVSRISKPEGDLKELQLLAILSIYYFHSDEDLLAWRTIGFAARSALEMGLHRKASLFKMFKDETQRLLATRIFWCIYVLDRRWSFGTSLSFALVDRDIDPELPEPGREHQYLQHMVVYGHLCSQIWDAIMSFDSSPPQFISEDTTRRLDLKTREWFGSVPPNLQLRHPRQGLAAHSQPRTLQRLRALLYLRANHTRILIHRHYLLSPAQIRANSASANLVVDIAKDTIDVLVHLHETSDIYSRQQSAFNYFLVAAIAVIFLAVCHEPIVYAEVCRPNFYAAVRLIRGFSRHGKSSRRLWESIKGLPPRLRRLVDMRDKTLENGGSGGGRREESGYMNGQPTRESSRDHRTDAQTSFEREQSIQTTRYRVQANMEGNGIMPQMQWAPANGAPLASITPTMLQMGDELVDLFEALLEQGQQQLPPIYGPAYYTNSAVESIDGLHGPDVATEMGTEVYRHFQELM